VHEHDRDGVIALSARIRERGLTLPPIAPK